MLISFISFFLGCDCDVDTTTKLETHRKVTEITAATERRRRFCADSDGDGYGDPDSCVVGRRRPPGYVGNADDCDDTDATVGGPATWYNDADGDGYGDGVYTTSACSQPDGYVANADDCNDYTDGINPEGVEYCDGVDNDCDGVIDDGDFDGDGYISADCGGDDCNDVDAAINPGAPEEMDWTDQDCDGVADEGCDTTCGWDYVTYYAAGYCRDDLYAFWLNGDLGFQCTGTQWYDP